MIAALLLTAFVAALSLVAPRLTEQAGRHGRPGRTWSQRTPRLAIGFWISATSAAVLAILLAGFALLFPQLPVSAAVARVLGVCVGDLRSHYTSPAGVSAAALGAVSVASIVGRLTYCGVVTAIGSARWRRRHAAAVQLVRCQRLGDVDVIEAADPLVYCLPGLGRIIASTGALARLTEPQLAVVLAHERAHLAQRHHWAIMWSSVLVRAFPFSTLARTARNEVARLAELRADDAAVQHGDPLDLADALLRLGTPIRPSSTPLPALAAATTAGAMRVRRLLSPAPPASRAQRAATVAVTVILAVAPVGVWAAPALSAHADSPAASAVAASADLR